MTDPMNEVLFGTPDLTPEEEQALMLQAAQSEQDFARMEAMANQQALAAEQATPAPTPVQQQPQPTQPAAEPQQPPTSVVQPERKYKTGSGFIYGSGDPDATLGEDIGTYAQRTFERLGAIGTGVADFALNMINVIPKKEVPGIENPFRPDGKSLKLPKFQDDVAQSIRELSSVVLPTVAITSGLTTGLTSATSGMKFFSDPFIKWLGPKLLGAGVGTGVEGVTLAGMPDEEVGHNLAGLAKKHLPAQFGWIPDNIATLDGEDPDNRRLKNLTEGTVLGSSIDMLEGVAKLFKARRGIRRATQWVPENEKAKAWLDANLEDDALETIEDTISKSAAKRSAALDELGEYNFSKSQNLDEPIFGVHDLYGYHESGIRSVDDLGIVAAQVDYARIEGNFDSVYGRVGSVVSEAALKYGLEIPEGPDVIIRGLSEQLKDAGEYGYRTASGRYLSFKDISLAGERLADDFYGLTTPQLKEAVRKFQYIDPNTETLVLKDEGYAAVFNTIKRYMNDYMDLDYMKAQALVGTSFGGQVSDMAQGMRLMAETPAVSRAQEQILDRLEFLMAQKGMTSYTRGRALNMLNLWNRLTDTTSKAFGKGEATRAANAIANEKNDTLKAIARIQADARGTIDTLRAVKAERPEMLAPLMMAYELTDGNVNSITKLNNYVRNSTGLISKAFYDGEADIPSMVLKGSMANVYNSTLSAVITPTKAGLSNIFGLAMRPIAQSAGYVMFSEGTLLKRAAFQYAAGVDTLQKGFSYMGQVFKRSASDPYVMSLREDMGVADEKQLQIFRAFADAKAQAGEFGPQAMLAQVEEINDLANHPWLRFGQRGMQAFDGFTQAVVANWEARGKAWDEVTKGGKLVLDSKKAQELSQKVYREMFDENDNITDAAVRHISGEISMSLDSKTNDAVSGLLRRLPALKPFLLFTKTPINDLKFTGSQNPMGLFIDLYHKYKRPFEEMPVEQVEQLLTSRGVEYTPETMKSAYTTVKAELAGRKAIGMLSVMGAVGLFTNDQITGDGLYDKEKQRLRRDADWKPRSIKVPGIGWVSYDGIPGVSNWLATTANILDNYYVLNSAELAEHLRAQAFSLAAAVTNKSMLAALEPLTDMLRGDIGAINRWTSSYATAAMTPGSSLMAEFARLIEPSRKEVDNNFFDLVANRNPILKQTLPNAHDWIDGGVVGEPPNFWARIWNTYLPWKVNGDISPEKQFLIDIEYDARPSLRTNGRGVEYSNEERSEVTNIMGQQGYFKQAIQQVMQSTEGKEFRKRFERARSLNLEPELESFEGLHMMLDSALRSSMRMAEAYVSTRDGIQDKQYKNQTVENFLKVGDIDGAEKFLKDMKQNLPY